MDDSRAMVRMSCHGTGNESMMVSGVIFRPSQKGTMGPNGCNTTAVYDQDVIEVKVGTGDFAN